MPARRSRTERWRESLLELCDRRGPIEISVSGGEQKSLIWRVRLLDVTDDRLIIEHPVTLRHKVPLEPGSSVVGGLAIGQNRWMFHSSVASVSKRMIDGREIDTVELSMPVNVERCQRRSFYRISTASLDLPVVKCFSLQGPAEAVAIEVATRAAIVDAAGAEPGAQPPGVSLTLPSQGPEGEGVLLNIGGGGACLQIPASSSSLLDRPGYFLLCVDLMPAVPLALPITAKLAHKRIDSSQNIQAGFSFDFASHREYEPFVAEQICRYVANLQQDGGPQRHAA